MAEQAKPVLQKPPGYKDPTAPAQAPLNPPPAQAPLKPPPAQVPLKPPPAGRKNVNPVLPVTLRPRKKRRRWCRSCCCFLCLLILILILLAAVAGCIFYLWYEPSLPVFRLQSLQFPRFNITSGPDGPALNSQAVVRIEVKNPNHFLRMNYGRTEVDLNSENVELGTAAVAGFTQWKRNTTVLKFTAEVKGFLVANGEAKRLKDGVRTKGLVVGTEVRTGIGVGADRWNTVRASVQVVCGGVSLKEVENGAVPKCKLYLFKWINIPI